MIEKILQGCTPPGKRFPSSYEPWEAIEQMALWLKERGIKAIFTFDLAMVGIAEGSHFPAIVCNRESTAPPPVGVRD
jgi:hypothetical protein